MVNAVQSGGLTKPHDKTRFGFRGAELAGWGVSRPIPRTSGEYFHSKTIVYELTKPPQKRGSARAADEN
jgi:hypothetical protein